MNLTKLNDRPGLEGKSRPAKAYNKFKSLIESIKNRDLSDDVITLINYEISILNSIPDNDKSLLKHIRKSHFNVIRKLEKDHKIVSKNYYKNLWMVLGMSAFGLPIGVAIATSLDNLAFLGIGLPIGMALGIAIGSSMDKKAVEDGRVLDFEPK
ncbi:hypothetical protein [Marinigracilibium pacificum]|uniref:Uncharacterized protein n=1 Tax=Marinigracilibium pacificum TaxID=2729599 RepID=A0A848IWR0_9BACT|nr:hypothetical protein [Marinigracilibium pacificum]NMM47715.1 hypothetical protein [Marinigracilibium pacificum]